MVLKKNSKGQVIVRTTRQLLREIERRIDLEGLECDLNYIDTSRITDMSCLFYSSKFVGDISKWDVSNVRNMRYMFYHSSFDGDLSGWNTGNVDDMTCMFMGSKFSGKGISEWNVEKVESMEYLFFEDYNFSADLSKWEPLRLSETSCMFERSGVRNPPDWFHVSEMFKRASAEIFHHL